MTGICAKRPPADWVLTLVLYLLAAPSTPAEVREEAVERGLAMRPTACGPTIRATSTAPRRATISAMPASRRKRQPVSSVIRSLANRFAVSTMMVRPPPVVRPDAFLDDTPTAVMIRQILGSVAQLEKAMLVSKLRGARAQEARDGKMRRP
jgi:hypothetical protein